MNIFLLGGTGKTGRLFLTMALENGHNVTAYVRSPEKMTAVENLTVVEGDMQSVEEMSRAMKNHDVVVSCLGGNDNDKTTVITDLTKVIIGSMQESGIEKIIAISSAGIHKEFSMVTNLIVSLFYKHVLNDHILAAQCIMTSGLSYTLARPLSLKDGELTKTYRMTQEGVPKGGKDLSRHDLAHFLLNEVEQGNHHNQTVGLAY